MDELNRDRLAALWQGILSHTGRPQEVFGEFSDRLLVCPEGHVDQLPHPGYVGRNYHRGGLLFLAMNPGNGTQGPDPGQEPHYAGLRRLKEASPLERREAFDGLMSYDETWHPQIRIMEVVVKPVMEGVGCDHDSIAYMNVLKWRTKDSSRLAPLYKISMKAHTLDQLEALDPGVIVLLGVGVSNVLHGIPDFEQRYAERCITVPRTIGDYHLAAAGQAAVQQACARFIAMGGVPPSQPLREPIPVRSPKASTQAPANPSPSSQTMTSPRAASGKPQADLNREKAKDYRERMHADASSRNVRLNDYLLEPGRDNDIAIGGTGPRHAIVAFAQKMAGKGATYGEVIGQKVKKGDGTLFTIGEGELLGYVCANGYCELKPPTH